MRWGLRAYAVIGAAKALALGVEPFVAVAMGVLTACFGGVIRDVLAGQPSALLKREITISRGAAGRGGLRGADALGVPALWAGVSARRRGFWLARRRHTLWLGVARVRRQSVAKEKLELVEVSPRDGLQNEPDIVSTENKLALIDHIVAAGFRRLEAGSFVNPKKVPQMADGDAVFAGLPKRDGRDVHRAGAQSARRRARAGGGREGDQLRLLRVAMDFPSATMAARWKRRSPSGPTWRRRRKQAARGLSATISTAFGCPFDGEVPVRARRRSG